MQNFTKDNLKKLLKERIFIGPDPYLSKYDAHNIRSYVVFCCENKRHLIEAYVIAIQYFELLIKYSFPKNSAHINEKTRMSPLISYLFSSGNLPKEIYDMYRDVKDKRDDFVHNLLFDTEAIRSFSKISPQVHRKKLDKLMDQGERFFLNKLREYPEPLMNTSANKMDKWEIKRYGIFTNLSLEKISKKIKIDSSKTEEENLEQYIKQLSVLLEKEIKSLLSTEEHRVIEH